MLHGVPQGSVQGPILFLMYINPLGKMTSSFKNVSHHLYTDDPELYCSFRDSEFHKLAELLLCLSYIKDWLTLNYLQLTEKKTETLIFTPELRVTYIKHYLGSVGSCRSTLR